MAHDSIRYDILVQDALRSVMRKVLQEVTLSGLPGEHHFFITFDTNAPGVRISTRLKEKYPDQMTIVMQYQFWDLKVLDTGFEIGLSFNDIPEKLVVPFNAVRGFYDPSVNFELEFDVSLVTPAPVAPLPAPGAQADNGVAQNATATSDAESNDPDDDDPSGGGEVVSLDAFRRKK